jgi:hypothetical protein
MAVVVAVVSMVFMAGCVDDQPIFDFGLLVSQE